MFKSVKLSEIHLDSQEPEPSPFMLERTVRLIEQKGQIENLVVVHTKAGYALVYGTHIYRALIQLSHKKAMCAVAATKSQADQLRLKLELSTTRFPAKQEQLGKMLGRLRDKLGPAAITSVIPMAEADMDLLIQNATEGWADYTSKKEYRDMKRNPVRQRTFTVSFDEEQWQRWGRLVELLGMEEQAAFEKVIQAYAMAHD